MGRALDRARDRPNTRRARKDGFYDHSMNAIEYVVLAFGPAQPTKVIMRRSRRAARRSRDREGTSRREPTCGGWWQRPSPRHVIVTPRHALEAWLVLEGRQCQHQDRDRRRATPEAGGAIALSKSGEVSQKVGATHERAMALITFLDDTSRPSRPRLPARRSGPVDPGCGVRPPVDPGYGQGHPSPPHPWLPATVVDLPPHISVARRARRTTRRPARCRRRRP